MRLERILKQPADSPWILFCGEPFGSARGDELLRAVLGLANAAENPAQDRYIVFGARARGGGVEVSGLADADFETLDSDMRQLRDQIEPALDISEIEGELDGKSLLILRLKDCFDPPYMIRTDQSEAMRQSACWIRKNGQCVPATRADFDRMYGRSAAAADAAESSTLRQPPAREKPATAPAPAPAPVAVGFNGDPACHLLTLDVPDIDQLPSQAAAERLEKAIEAKQSAMSLFGAEDTGMARLVHVELHGVETPFVAEGIDTMIEGYNAGTDERRDADLYFLYEKNALRVNLAIANKSGKALADVEFRLTLPRVRGFDVADKLFAPPGKRLSKTESGLMGYPQVRKTAESAVVKRSLGTLQPGMPGDIFPSPLRLAVSPAMRGKKVALNYSISSPGLKEPVRGRLKILFAP